MSTAGPGEATELWLLWKRAYELVRTAVVTDVARSSSLSESELSVLVCLYESGGVLRQNAVAASLGWDRTRLSHQLTRMEKRGYVARTKVANGVEVALLPEGRRTIEASVPALDASTQRHMVDRLGPDGATALKTVVERLLKNDGAI